MSDDLIYKVADAIVTAGDDPYKQAVEAIRAIEELKMTELKDEQAARMLRALEAEGFTAPFSAHVSNYVPDHMTDREAKEARLALRAADEQAEADNLDALRRAVGAAFD